MGINKEKVADSFAASYKTYDKHAVVQKELAERLLAMIPQQRFPRVLEIGCGTGYLAEKLTERQIINELYLNDLSKELCTITQQRIEKRVARDCTLPANIHLLSGDIENISLPKELDLIFSSSTLQWIEDLEKLFCKIHKTLNKKGLFIFSIFTKGTMQEIAALTGRGLQYYSKEELQEMLAKNFTIKKIEQRENRLSFASLITLFKHIRWTGVGGVDDGGRRWTRRLMKEFEEEYRRRYGSEEGLPLSYAAHSFFCEK